MKKKIIKNKSLIAIIGLVVLIAILSLKPVYLFKRFRYKYDVLKENVTTTITIDEGYIYEDEYAVGKYYYFKENNCIIDESGHDNKICTIDVNTLKDTGYVTIEGIIINSFDDTIVTLNGDIINNVKTSVIETKSFLNSPYIKKRYVINIGLNNMPLNNNSKLQIINGYASKTIEINFKK